MENKEKMSKLEEKLYKQELREIHSQMQRVVDATITIFKKYGKSGFDTELAYRVNDFMKDNFGLKYNYNGEFIFDKDNPVLMKIPEKLDQLIKEYSINNFIQKLDDVQAATEDLYNRTNQ